MDDLRAVEDRHVIAPAGKLPISIERGEGLHVWDERSVRYLDLYGGHAVALVGHSHPRVAAAVAAQASKLFFYTNAVYSSVRGRAARSRRPTRWRGSSKRRCISARRRCGITPYRAAG